MSVIRLGRDAAGAEVVLDVARVHHVLLTASSGYGKSSGIRLLVERLLDHQDVQVLVVDVEGEFGTLAETGRFIRFGPGGHFRVEPETSEYLARQCVELGFSVVVCPVCGLAAASGEARQLDLGRFAA